MIGHLTQLSPPLCQGNFGPRGLTGRKGNPGERVSHTVESAFSMWWVGGVATLVSPPLSQGPVGPVGRPAPAGGKGNKVGRLFFTQL